MPFHEVQPDALWDRIPLPYQRGDREPPVVMLDEPDVAAVEPPRRLMAMWARARSPGFSRTLVAAVLGAAIGAAGTYAGEHASSWYSPAPDPLAVGVNTGALVAAHVLNSGTVLMPVTLTYRGGAAVRIAAVRYSSSDGQLAWWGDGQSLAPGKTTQLWGYLQLRCGHDGSPGDGLWVELFTSAGTDRLLRLRSGVSQSTFRVALHHACS